MIESGCVLALDCETVLYWHKPNGATAGGLPDDRLLWEALWDNRNNLSGFAHTHPGSGYFPLPSSIDISTFKAIEYGLGVRLGWWILNGDSSSFSYWLEAEKRYVTSSGYLNYCPECRGPHSIFSSSHRGEIEHSWIDQLRQNSQLG